MPCGQQVKVLGKAVAHFSQPKRGSKDQALHGTLNGISRHSAASDVQKSSTTSVQQQKHEVASSASRSLPQTSCVGDNTSRRPRLAGSLGRADHACKAIPRPASSNGPVDSTAGRGSQAISKTKPPIRSSFASGPLRLKAKAAGTHTASTSTATANAMPTGSEHAANQLIPSRSIDFASTLPAAPDGAAGKQQQMISKDATSRACGSRPASASSAGKPLSSVRKTFKFFHTE
jgi:hypothetical protein